MTETKVQEKHPEHEEVKMTEELEGKIEAKVSEEQAEAVEEYVEEDKPTESKAAEPV